MDAAEISPHIIVEHPGAVVLDHLLPAALALPHGGKRPVPVKQLEHRHQLLKIAPSQQQSSKLPSFLTFINCVVVIHAWN